MTLTELITELRYLISDTDTTNPKWSDTVLTNRLQTASVQFVGITDAIKTSNATDPVDIVAGTNGYSLPTDCMKLVRVSFKDTSGNWKKLQEITKEELDLNSSNWEDATNSTCSHYINNVSGNNVRVYPTPTVSQVDSLRYEYVKEPDTLVAGTQALDAQSNLKVFHQILCFYSAFLCKSDEKKNDEANTFYSHWLKGLDDAKKQLASRTEDQRIPNIYESSRKMPLRGSRFSSNPFNK